jgi:hypothetical protein
LCSVYFWVDDVEAMYSELRERGAKIDYELSDKPYGCREFAIQDLDGHDIAFGQCIGEGGHRYQLAAKEKSAASGIAFDPLIF